VTSTDIEQIIFIDGIEACKSAEQGRKTSNIHYVVAG